MKKSENIKIIENKIIEKLEEIRPFLNMEGGDISFIKYEENIVYVKMLGACANCISQDDTLKEGILLMLQEEVPNIIDVINVLL